MKRQPPMLSGETVDLVLTWIYMSRETRHPMWAKKGKGRSYPWHYLDRVFVSNGYDTSIRTNTRCGQELSIRSIIFCPTPLENRSNIKCEACVRLVNMDGLAE